MRLTPMRLALLVPSAMALSLNVGSMSYRELQVACKERGLKAVGSAEALRERLGAVLDLAEAKPAEAKPTVWSHFVADDEPLLDVSDDLDEEELGEDVPHESRDEEAQSLFVEDGAKSSGEWSQFVAEDPKSQDAKKGDDMWSFLDDVVEENDEREDKRPPVTDDDLLRSLSDDDDNDADEPEFVAEDSNWKNIQSSSKKNTQSSFARRSSERESAKKDDDMWSFLDDVVEDAAETEDTRSQVTDDDLLRSLSDDDEEEVEEDLVAEAPKKKSQSKTTEPPSGRRSRERDEDDLWSFLDDVEDAEDAAVTDDDRLRSLGNDDDESRGQDWGSIFSAIDLGGGEGPEEYHQERPERSREDAAREALIAVSKDGDAAEIGTAWDELCEAVRRTQRSPTDRDGEKALWGLASCAAVDETVAIIRDLEAFKGSASSRAWRSALFAFAKAGKLDDGEKFALQAMRRGTFPAQPTLLLYQSLLKASKYTGNWRRAMEILNEMHDRDDLIAPTRGDMELGLVAACKANYLQSDVAWSRIQRGAPLSKDELVDDDTAKAPARFLARIAALDETVSMENVISVLGAASHAARPDLALRYLAVAKRAFQDARLFGRASDDDVADMLIQCYSIAIGTCRRRADMIFKFIQWQSRRRHIAAAQAAAATDDVPPPPDDDDGIDYDGLTKERAELAEKVTKVVEELVALDDVIQPKKNETRMQMAFTLAAATCGRCREPTKAERILKMAKQRGAKHPGRASFPTDHLYTTVLAAFEAADLDHACLALLREIPQKDIGVAVFNICLQACAKKGDVRKARELLETMRASENPTAVPDKYTYPTAIGSCKAAMAAIRGNPHPDSKVPKRRRQRSPNPNGYSSAAASAVDFLKLAVQDGLANEVTFRAALRSCMGFDTDPEPLLGDAALGLAVIDLLRKSDSDLRIDDVMRQRLHKAAHASNGSFKVPARHVLSPYDRTAAADFLGSDDDADYYGDSSFDFGGGSSSSSRGGGGPPPRRGGGSGGPFTSSSSSSSSSSSYERSQFPSQQNNPRRYY